MTSRFIDLDTGAVRETTDREFYARLFGHYPKTRAERDAESAAYWAKRREENRREIERIRDNLCKLASPELAAKFRAQWDAEDASDPFLNARKDAA